MEHNDTTQPAPAPLGVGPLTLRSPRHRVDRRFIVWRTLQALLWGIGVLGAMGVLYWLAQSTRPWLGPLLVIVGALYVVNITVMPTWRYRVHRWETTDKSVYTLEGWITRRWHIIPISRIQSIDAEIGLLQQMLGLATITITTASGEGKITIEGLDAAVAQTTVSHLNEITSATAGDAT